MAQDLEKKLKRLQKVDHDISYYWNKVASAQIYLLSQTPRFGPWYKDHVFVAGSQTEGAFYAKMFLDGKHINEGDYMFSVGNIRDPTFQLQPIEHSLGYFKVRYNGICGCLHDGIRERFIESLSTEQESNCEFLTCSSVMDMTENMFTSTTRKTQDCAFIADVLFQPQEPSKGEVIFQRRGPSVMTGVVLTSAGKHLAEVQVDTVPCFKLSLWPKDFGFEEFQNRQRSWPSNPDDVEKIKDMVHIVPKWSPKEEESERDYCWRLSFSKAEIHLTSLFSEKEHLVYLLFKIMFYAHIKIIETNGKTMASYFCKTTMLWMMEEEGAELCKNVLLETVRKLFNKLKQYLDSDSGLPNFFHPSINLLEGYPPDLITRSSAMIGKITKSPLQYFPSNFNEVCDNLEKFLNREEFKNFIENVSGYIKEGSHLKGSTITELFMYANRKRKTCS